jgi:hypothetical protein
VNEFWKRKSLEEMDETEWESLCDGCAKCCLIKFREPDSGLVKFTNVVCRYLNLETCQCGDYPNRHQNVPECVFLTPELARHADWLPATCAYRLVADGKDLPWWHPLKTHDPNSARRAGGTVYHKVVSEEEVDDADLEDMVVNWFD